MNTEWGFDELLSLDTLNDASNGYLVDDCCVFGAEVFVLKCNGQGECRSMMKDPMNNIYTWKVNKLSPAGNIVFSDQFVVGENAWQKRHFEAEQYVSVGVWKDVHLFYYFIESEGNPREDPLLLWLTGPGCSAFSGLVYEIGPLRFDTEHFDGKFPNFKLNLFSWTKVASIIFLDAPVGTEFSYADNAESYVVDDLLSTTNNCNFLLKWLMNHPIFLSNELYIAGDSYSGIIAPIIVQKIYDGNSEVGVQPLLKLQGYIIGNPVTSQHYDKNARIEFAHRLALLSDKLYECLANLYMGQILEPNCAYASRNSSKLKWDRRFIEAEPTDFLLLPVLPKFWCRTYNYIPSYIWANDERVRQALHIRKETKEKWARCNESMAYTEVVFNSLDYHRNLSHTTLRALIYSGDHDMAVPYLGTHKWIEALNLTVDEEWRPWFVDGQNGGYTMSCVRKGYHLTFATIKARKKKFKLTSASISKGEHKCI
ncbi:serine carboxypeptidase-like 1 [Rhododendron vialii]|uniref:serine carboxypeptidase-like 1 n=1 Tax=Rhododendron vialii TaxID=182163 RepID=UPI00265F2D20|nr:serine carboxypeptidase-like 1 [Rhododendron vialii]